MIQDQTVMQAEIEKLKNAIPDRGYLLQKAGE